MINRRRFLQTGLTGAMLANPISRFAWADTADDARLIIVILRGGMDGLASVPPYSDPSYSKLRGNLTIEAPRSTQGMFDLDGFFGLHPRLKHLYSMYEGGELIVTHGVATPYRERSHFDGQKLLENGTNHPLGAKDGWLNRAIPSISQAKLNRSEYAMALAQSIPLILYGEQPVGSWSPSPLPEVNEDLITRIAEMYSDDEFFLSRLNSAITTREFADDIAGNIMVGTGGRGRNAQFTPIMKAAGRFLSSTDGPRVAVIDSNGWDTHANQGAINGQLANRLTGLDEGVAALKKELGPVWSKTIITIVTEFGRTVAVNGTGGTDHGTAGVSFIAGGAVNGGKILADWRGLSKSALYENRDLFPTMDMRSIFKSILHDHLQVSTAMLNTSIFPQSDNAVYIPDLIRG